MPRFHVALPLTTGLQLTLPPAVTRHVQVLRLQPGDAITLFDGSGFDWSAVLLEIGRHSATVQVGNSERVDRELPVDVTLAVGMPANDRMDWLVEKATELGVETIQPLHCERSVLRLGGDRADKKLAHWRGVAAAAAEQSGRSIVPRLLPVRALPDWLASLAPAQLPPGDRQPVRVVLSLGSPSEHVGTVLNDALQAIGAHSTKPRLIVLSGPEGGLSATEDAAARAAAFRAVSLGPRVLRAETAPLALLAALSVMPA